MDVIKRSTANKINSLHTNLPACVIPGTRQSGKRPLAKLSGTGWEYFDLENPNHFRRIFEDPVLFFREFPDQDNRERYGRFILTGSARFDLTTQISKSLAGRVGTVELHPCKMDEILGKPLGAFFEKFEQKFTAETILQLKNLRASKDIAVTKYYLLRGGYPEPILRKDAVFW